MIDTAIDSECLSDFPTLWVLKDPERFKLDCLLHHLCLKCYPQEFVILHLPGMWSSRVFSVSRICRMVPVRATDQSAFYPTNIWHCAPYYLYVCVQRYSSRCTINICWIKPTSIVIPCRAYIAFFWLDYRASSSVSPYNWLPNQPPASL